MRRRDYCLVILVILFNLIELGISQSVPENTTVTTVPLFATTPVICSVNETFKECSSMCENSCMNSTEICSNGCGPPNCDCLNGFYRNSTGWCVLGHDCDSYSVTGNLNCSSLLCPLGYTCTVGQVDCVDCEEVPMCVLDVPIEYEDISNNNTCPQNETWLDCGSLCEDMCGKETQICSNICAEPQCQCRPGFYRNLTGNCVQGHDCSKQGQLEIPKPPLNDTSIVKGCELISCGDDYKCEVDSGEASCVPITEENICDVNEEWQVCKISCEPTCAQSTPMCATVCADSGCQCISGYFRADDGSCVKDCLAIAECGSTEIATDCMPQCEPTCHGVPSCQGISTTECSPGCICQANHKRNRMNKCVRNNQCYHSAGCDENEEWVKCVQCENRCGVDNSAMCSSVPPTTSCSSGCGCVTGYARNTNDTCVATIECV